MIEYFSSKPRKVFKVATIIIGIFLSGSASAQPNYWKDLEDVTYKNRTEESTGFNITYPIFGKKVKSLEGKQIILKGFMVPLDELTGKNRFVLSSLPFNICFFCGGAGPETVIEVHSKNHIEFTDDPIWIQGKFYANEEDPEQLMYLLHEAELIEK